MSDVPNPLYAYAFLAGACFHSISFALTVAILLVWCAYGLYKQLAAGVPVVS